MLKRYSTFFLDKAATSLQKKKHKTGLKAAQMGTVPPRNTFWMVESLPDRIMSEPAEIARWLTHLNPVVPNPGLGDAISLPSNTLHLIQSS